MPGYNVCITFFPRFRYEHEGRIVYAPEAWGQMMGLQPLPRLPTDGIYAVESVSSQNFFDYIVYSRPGPMALFVVGLPWHREAYRVVEHPIFYDLLVRMYGNPGAVARNYAFGSSQVELLGRNIAGPMSGTAYVMRDYSGAVDAWIRFDISMPPGTYQHLRLTGVYEPADWYRVTAVRPMGLVYGTPEPHSRM